jgi:hypothetical protein
VIDDGSPTDFSTGRKAIWNGSRHFHLKNLNVEHPKRPNFTFILLWTMQEHIILKKPNTLILSSPLPLYKVSIYDKGTWGVGTVNPKKNPLTKPNGKINKQINCTI